MNKKIKSIKVKTIMFLIPMLLTAFIVLSGLGYKFASDSLRTSNLNVMSEMTKTAAARANDQIQSEIKNLEVIASNPTISNENISLVDKVQIVKPELKIIKQLDISISDNDGNAIDAAGNKINIKTTQSFMKSIKGENSITNPYTDPISKKKVIAYSVPIKNFNGNIIGIIRSVKDCMDFSSINSDVSFLKTGSSLIVDSNGNFIVAEDENLVSGNKNITTMTSDKGSLSELNNIGKSMILGGKSGIGKYTYEGNQKYITYSPIGTTGLSIGITVDEKDLLNALNSLATVDTVVTITMLLLITVIMICFTVKVINRLLGAKDYVDSIANGDFYSQIDERYFEAKDEISAICTSVGQAKLSVGRMVKLVKDNAGIVRNGSVELNDIAEQLTVLTEEISASIGEIATRTNKESSEFEEISNKLSIFGDEINLVKDNVNLISNDVMIINNRSLKGTKDIEQLNNEIISVNNSFERFSTSVEYIQGDMKNVHEITNIINGISEQINLLSFNAAIEAASAGEAGKGFNVIALEVKKLSDKSRESAQNINKIINRLMKVIKQLVEESNNMDNELEKQKNAVYNASSSFAEIAVLVKEITPKVSNINNSFENIISNKDLIVETVSELSEEIKNTSNSLLQVTDSSVELALLSEKVNNSSDVLLDKADDLIEKVKQFRIEQDHLRCELITDRYGEDQDVNDIKLIELKLKEISHDNKENMRLVLEDESNLEYLSNHQNNLDSASIAGLSDLDVSLLEMLDEDLYDRDFEGRCSKVKKINKYIRERVPEEYEKEYKEFKGYNII